MAITLATPGATRMYAWPWSFLYTVALAAPAVALLLRALDARSPVILPAVSWQWAAIGAAAGVLVSGMVSPYRGPSVLWSAPLLAAVAFFFVAYDELQRGAAWAVRVPKLVGGFFAIIVVTSIALWLPGTFGLSLNDIATGRNPFPLGHANYTAGLALLALPWLAALAWRARGAERAGWSAAVVLAFVMLLGSGSRAGLVGFAALGFAALALSALSFRQKFLIGVGLIAVGLGLALAHPRIRAMLAPADPMNAPNISTVQRAAMVMAAKRMGADRPLLGWGPGTTPLAYPRYRAGLDGGAENVLQLHNTPAHIWGELGAVGLLGAAALGLLALRHARRHPVAFVTLAGYAVFSLGDWQLDVPVFGFTLAFCGALLAPPAGDSTRLRRFGLVAAVLVSGGVIVWLGRPDPTPELNVRALTLARDPGRTDEAVALLRESLAQNPEQEIAHFNLGWLLLVRDPVAAEKHFIAAAHLVPDKGGVYFGLGLARLNQNHAPQAAGAFAVECLNDPLFLLSPWWREPGIAPLRAATLAEFAYLFALAEKKIPPRSWAAAHLARLNASALPAAFVPVLPPGPERAYRRERSAYPVLMRNLDLPPPTDLYDVREPATPPPGLPPKGWLPTPLLLELLDAPARNP